MKKTLSFIAAMLLALAFTACGDDTQAAVDTTADTTTTSTSSCVPAPGEICQG